MEIRPYAASDRPKLVDLLAEVWSHKRPLEDHVDRRWWWRWHEPPLYVIEDRAASRLAGLCAYLPFTLRARGGQRSCAWFVDFYIRAAYQGRGLGRGLTQEVQRRFEVTASLSQTAMAWRVFQRLGWHERVPVSLQMLPLAPFAYWTAAASTPRDIRILRSDCPDDASAPELDKLWLSVRDAYPAIAVRDSCALASRFAPAEDRRYGLLTCHRGNECTGYMVVRTVGASEQPRRHAVGLVVDYLTAPGDLQTLGALLTEAARVLRANDVQRIYCLVTPPSHRRSFARRTFLSPETPILGRFLQAQTKWLTYFADGDCSVGDPAGWFLTLADCDLDYVWY